MKKDLKDIFENLTGNWTLKRTINHVDSDLIDKAIGTATFSRSDLNQPNSLYYKETGKLYLQKGAKEINFRREYIYTLNKESIEIILNDGVTKGQLFQTLSPQESNLGLKGSEHICRLDKHNGAHFFETETSFRTEYSVTGPNTNLRIETNYEKRTTDNKS